MSPANKYENNSHQQKSKPIHKSKNQKSKNHNSVLYQHKRKLNLESYEKNKFDDNKNIIELVEYDSLPYQIEKDLSRVVDNYS